jgi:hypothetical protein
MLLLTLLHEVLDLIISMSHLFIYFIQIIMILLDLDDVN